MLDHQQRVVKYHQHHNSIIQSNTATFIITEVFQSISQAYRSYIILIKNVLGYNINTFTTLFDMFHVILVIPCIWNEIKNKMWLFLNILSLNPVITPCYLPKTFFIS